MPVCHLFGLWVKKKCQCGFSGAQSSLHLTNGSLRDAANFSNRVLSFAVLQPSDEKLALEVFYDNIISSDLVSYKPVNQIPYRWGADGWETVQNLHQGFTAGRSRRPEGSCAAQNCLADAEHGGSTQPGRGARLPSGTVQG